MRLWSEQAYPAHNIYVPRKVAHAKGNLTIPQDPWQSFPDAEDVVGPRQVDPMFSYGVQAVNSGYQSCWTGSYAMRDWQHVVTYLEERTDQLQRVVGACFR